MLRLTPRSSHLSSSDARLSFSLSSTCFTDLFKDDQGVFSGVVNNADWLDTFGHPGSGLEGIIVSIYNLVCASSLYHRILRDSQDTGSL